MVNIEQIKKLREETGVSIIECRKALMETNGDLGKAKNTLKKWGKEIAMTKSERKAGEGMVDAYIHPNKKIGVLLDLGCESDFVARSEDFKKLSHELCLQIAAMAPIEAAFLSQPWIRDEEKTIKDLLNDHIVKLGENIVVRRFMRFEI